jgi:hypothetical protein
MCTTWDSAGPWIYISCLHTHWCPLSPAHPQWLTVLAPVRTEAQHFVHRPLIPFGWAVGFWTAVHFSAKSETWGIQEREGVCLGKALHSPLISFLAMPLLILKILTHLCWNHSGQHPPWAKRQALKVLLCDLVTLWTQPNHNTYLPCNASFHSIVLIRPRVLCESRKDLLYALLCSWPKNALQFMNSSLPSVPTEAILLFGRAMEGG